MEVCVSNGQSAGEEKVSDVGCTCETAFDAGGSGACCAPPCELFQRPGLVEIGRHVNVLNWSEKWPGRLD